MMPRTFFAALMGVTAAIAVPMQAGGAQVCAWLVESNDADDVRNVDLWLQADKDIDFLLKIGGDGIITASGKSNSPETATYSLNAGKAEKAWGTGFTADWPGAIDITAELHKTPADIFSDAPTPLLASFAFGRKIPASEKKPPNTLARKQCVALK
jgi:hypothetical protein